MLEIVQGDLLEQPVDTIVNAANPALLGGAGVNGAIHKAAGPMLLSFCESLPEVRPNVRCPTGKAVITPAFELEKRGINHIIHTVGPVYNKGSQEEAALLSHCYTSTLALAEEKGIASLAFPAISTGVYGYPSEEAVAIALQAILDYCQAGCKISKVILVFRDDDRLQEAMMVLNSLQSL